MTTFPWTESRIRSLEATSRNELARATDALASATSALDAVESQDKRAREQLQAALDHQRDAEHALETVKAKLHNLLIVSGPSASGLAKAEGAVRTADVALDEARARCEIFREVIGKIEPSLAAERRNLMSAKANVAIAEFRHLRAQQYVIALECREALRAAEAPFVAVTEAVHAAKHRLESEAPNWRGDEQRFPDPTRLITDGAAPEPDVGPMRTVRVIAATYDRLRDRRLEAGDLIELPEPEYQANRAVYMDAAEWELAQTQKYARDAVEAPAAPTRDAEFEAQKAQLQADRENARRYWRQLTTKENAQ